MKITCLCAKARLVFYWCWYHRLGNLSLDMHYLFLKAYSLLQATLSENCSLLILVQYVSSLPYPFNVSKESLLTFVVSSRVEQLSKKSYNNGAHARREYNFTCLTSPHPPPPNPTYDADNYYLQLHLIFNIVLTGYEVGDNAFFKRITALFHTSFVKHR